MGAAEWGVQQRWQDAAGTWHEVAAETVERVLDAMGTDGDGSPSPGPTLFVSPDRKPTFDGPADLTLENGEVVRIEGALPSELPFGYHSLVHLEDGRRADLVVSPGRCPLPASAPTWGWAVQLYAVRSEESWGMGDLGDLRRLGRWSKQQLAAGLVLVNPLHAAHPTLPQSSSPYFPSSRRFRNPLYLRIEDVDGAGSLEDLESLVAAGRALKPLRARSRAVPGRIA